MTKKKLFIIIYSVVLISSIFSESLKIMSFNLNGTQKSHRLETNEQWANDIVAIIKQSEADIVLLQEVTIELDKRLDTKYFKNPRKNNVLDYFCRKLSGFGGKWEYFTSAGYMLQKDIEIEGETYSSGNKTQNNAILYNTRKLKGKDRAKEFGFDKFNGKFLFDKNSVQVIEFVELATNSKINIVNVHIPHNNFDRYYRDFNTLERLYAQLKSRSAVIIGGDFNTHRKSLNDRNFDNVDGTSSWYYSKEFGLLTTIQTNNEENFGFRNSYDHFIFSNKIKEIQIMKRVKIPDNKQIYDSIQIGNNRFYNSYEYYERISDHFPIIFEFEIIS